MANLEVIALNPATPQLRAPGASDSYLFPRKAIFNGNVGIGTSAPGAPLDVNGNIYGRTAVYSDGFRSYTGGATLLTITGGGTGDIALVTGATGDVMRLKSGGNVGIGTTAPTAVLHLKAGTATASTAPLKFTSGANLTTPEAGAMEYNGTDLFFTRSGTTRETVFTLATDSASPAAKTLSAQGSRVGTDTNIGGGDFTITPGTGTGTGTPSSLALQSPVAVGSGTGAQTQTTGLTIKNGCAVPRATTVASLPAAGSNTDAMLIVTDALTTLALGIGTAVAGGGANRVGVRSDGINWIYSF